MPECPGHISFHSFSVYRVTQEPDIVTGAGDMEINEPQLVSWGVRRQWQAVYLGWWFWNPWRGTRSPGDHLAEDQPLLWLEVLDSPQVGSLLTLAKPVTLILFLSS